MSRPQAMKLFSVLIALLLPAGGLLLLPTCKTNFAESDPNEQLRSVSDPLSSCPGTCVVSSSSRCVDPTNCGAIGDGVTDDTAALQCAINAAVSYGRPNPDGGVYGDRYGGEVCIPNGIFKISSSLTIGSPLAPDGGTLNPGSGAGNLTIRGMGKEASHLRVSSGITAIKSASPQDGFGPANLPLLNVRLEDFTIAFELGPTGAVGTGIDFTGFSHSQIARVAVVFAGGNMRGTGLYMAGSAGHLIGKTPHYNRVDEFDWNSEASPSLPGAYGIDLEPANTTTLVLGPNNNRFFGGHLAGGNIGVKITAGDGNVMSGIGIESIGYINGADTVPGAHYEFGDYGLALNFGTGAIGNSVFGGYDEEGLSPCMSDAQCAIGTCGGKCVLHAKHLARFWSGAAQNVVHAVYNTGVTSWIGVDVDADNLSYHGYGSNNNRVILGGTEIISYQATGSAATQFLTFRTQISTFQPTWTTSIFAARPTTAPIITFPNTAGNVTVGP